MSAEPQPDSDPLFGRQDAHAEVAAGDDDSLASSSSDSEEEYDPVSPVDSPDVLIAAPVPVEDSPTISQDNLTLASLAGPPAAAQPAGTAQPDAGETLLR